MAFHVQCHTLCILVTNLLQISIFKYSIEYREYMYVHRTFRSERSSIY